MTAGEERSVVQFNADLSRHAALVGAKVDLIVKGFCQTLFNEVQSGGKYSPGTPIKTGFHRANWSGGIGTESPTLGGTDVRASAQRLEAVALEAKAGDVIVMANNGPAINRLENGSSRQAPGGFIRLALMHSQQILDEVAVHVLRAA